MSLICIVLTKSPMIFIFISIFLFCYFYKNIIFAIKKFYLSIIIFSILFFTLAYYLIPQIDFSNNYLYRIVNTLQSIATFNFNMLIYMENSLATRIVSYVNTFILFLDKPFIGYGFDNVRFYIIKYFLNSPLPLTPENKTYLNIALTSKLGMSFNRSLLSGLLSETGLIGTFLYFLFLYKNIKYIDRLKP